MVISLNDDLRLLDGMELVSTETSENESKKYYLFEGKGRIFYKGSRKYRDDDNNKIILMSTTDGSFDWVEEIPVENVYNVVPNIEVDEQGSIYIGMNTKVDISDFNSGSINSFGGIDILLFRISSIGTIEETHHYGSSDNELLIDFHYADRKIFIGGEMSGNSTKRKKLVI